ncbi:rhodanese-like domain-containing protein [Pontibacter sp. Tf4]|uniref:rhodanese-like domain-containing protein n=1 Tax=Pontibacter sp. Tf4 TaxID=2761620 RepID=UPI00162499E4|nr:rhodanese-like domain-containing protein [Pontibacter sp. Tf4]MBB6612473.1 rhodanese-like domain-containing protein [Pontibacter sp. Tf4]
MKLILVTIVSAFFSCGQPQQDATTAKRLTPTEYKQQATTQKGVLIDVRTQEEFASGHLQGAANSDLLNGDFAKSLDGLDKEKTYYLYCKSGNRSGKAAKLMQDAGFKNVFNIGGYEELKSAGLPTKE